MMLKDEKIVRLTPEQIALTVLRQSIEKARAEAAQNQIPQQAGSPHPKFPVLREI